MRWSKRFDIFILTLYFLSSTLFVNYFQVNSTIATILYLDIPSIYLLLKYSTLRRQILIFSVPISLILSTAVEFFATYNKVWVANSHLPRIFGFLSLESFLWWPFWVIIVIASYNVFVDSKDRKLNKNFKWFEFILLCSILFFFVWLLSGLQKVDYSYIKIFGFPLIIPIFYVLVRKRKRISEIAKFSLVFAFFALIYEIVGLKLSHWAYPGEYIGKINLFGTYIPFEEIFFWIILGSASLVSCYEIVTDEESLFKSFLQRGFFLRLLK